MIANWGMAAFLGVMAATNAWNCWLLLRDKEVRGLAPVTVLLRSCANIWQAWFFYALHQWASFLAAVPATGLNLAWVALAFHYRSRNNPKRQASLNQVIRRLGHGRLARRCGWPRIGAAANAVTKPVQRDAAVSSTP